MLCIPIASPTRHTKETAERIVSLGESTRVYLAVLGSHCAIAVRADKRAMLTLHCHVSSQSPPGILVESE
jgi:hypothetical protein